jgi:hypothetical protein
LTLLITLTIASHSLLRGQVVKKIGNDSVVIMTIKQGIAINNLIDSLESQVYKKSDSLSMLNKKVDRIVDRYNDSILIINNRFLMQKESLVSENRVNKDTLNDYKNRYYKNIDIYNQYEKDMNFELKLHRLNSVLFAALTFFLYSQIK